MQQFSVGGVRNVFAPVAVYDNPRLPEDDGTEDVTFGNHSVTIAPFGSVLLTSLTSGTVSYTCSHTSTHAQLHSHTKYSLW